MAYDAAWGRSADDLQTKYFWDAAREPASPPPRAPVNYYGSLAHQCMPTGVSFYYWTLWLKANNLSLEYCQDFDEFNDRQYELQGRMRDLCESGSREDDDYEAYDICRYLHTLGQRLDRFRKTFFKSYEFAVLTPRHGPPPSKRLVRFEDVRVIAEFAGAALEDEQAELDRQRRRMYAGEAVSTSADGGVQILVEQCAYCKGRFHVADDCYHLHPELAPAYFAEKRARQSRKASIMKKRYNNNIKDNRGGGILRVIRNENNLWAVKKKNKNNNNNNGSHNSRQKAKVSAERREKAHRFLLDKLRHADLASRITFPPGDASERITSLPPSPPPDSQEQAARDGTPWLIDV